MPAKPLPVRFTASAQAAIKDDPDGPLTARRAKAPIAAKKPARSQAAAARKATMKKRAAGKPASKGRLARKTAGAGAAAQA